MNVRPIPPPSRHEVAALSAALIVVIAVCALLLAPSVDAGKGRKAMLAQPFTFSLVVHHPEGTVLEPNEVVYVATPDDQAAWDCMTAGLCWFQARHVCEGQPFEVDQRKALWYPEFTRPASGDAYFLAFGTSCTGVIVDLYAGSVELSPRVVFAPPG